MTTTYLELQVLSTGQTSRLAEMFRLLGEPNRLSLVYACLEEPQSVQTLAPDESLLPPNDAQHRFLPAASRR